MSGIMAMLLGRVVGGGTFTVVQTFTASGTWTAPTGVTEVEYLVVAGGGHDGVLRLASGPEGSFQHRVATDLKALLERRLPYKVVLAPAANSPEQVQLLLNGKADIGLVAPASLRAG